VLATCDPAVLAAAHGRTAVARLVDDHAGEPLLVRFEGAWPDRIDPGALEALPALTVAVGAPDPLAAAFDLATADHEQADRWCAAFESAPVAAWSCAMLVRHSPPSTWAGLVAESAVYSTLQSSPRFREWLAGARPAGGDDHDRPRVRVARRGRGWEVVLTRADRHNALDVRMRDALHAALGDLAAGDGPIVVRAEGPSFCSGGDLGEFGTFPDPASAHVIRLSRSLAWRFAELSPRLVVLLHGACLGAGIELPAFAARVVAADDAVIGLPELGLGLIPGAGGTVSIPRRAGRQRLLELLLRQEPIDAGTARAWGLVDEVVPRAQLDGWEVEAPER
jgi:enoyl-CoA hydratase/carnithine racemase